jgi:sugar phosphate permease
MNYSKAIGAALGGAVTGAGTGAIMLPEGSPWYAYVLMAAITAALPALITYLAPKNAP